MNNVIVDVQKCPSTDKRCFGTQADAELFERKNREEYRNPRQWAYKCPDCPNFHLSSHEPTETSSRSYAAVRLPNIPERQPRSIRAEVAARRERVLIAIQDHNKSYAELARELEINEEIFASDVTHLKKEGLYAGRNKTQMEIPMKTKLGTDPADRVRALRAALEAAEREVELAEAAKREREKLSVDWIVNENGKFIHVAKLGVRVLFSVDAWREVTTTLAEVIGMYDRGEVTFPTIDGATNGTIISGQRAGEIHEDFR
jgi:hypothetical protein